MAAVQPVSVVVTIRRHGNCVHIQGGRYDGVPAAPHNNTPYRPPADTLLSLLLTVRNAAIHDS